MREHVFDMLECPECHGELEYELTDYYDDRVESGIAVCSDCIKEYPISEGIGIFVPEGRPVSTGSFDRSATHFTRFLHRYPELEDRLMSVPADQLSPADRFIRGLVLEERGEFNEARRVMSSARTDLYTAETLHCWDSQFDFLIDSVGHDPGTVLDLSSGRCYLVETLARLTQASIIATDHDPRVLRQSQRYLRTVGLYNRVSLLAIDPCRSPFKDDSVPQITSFQGLQSVRDLTALIAELRRIVSGRILSIQTFYPEGNEPNAETLRAHNMESQFFKDAFVDTMESAGLQLALANERTAREAPCQPGEVIQGAVVNPFPVTETRATWCTVVAKRKGAC